MAVYIIQDKYDPWNRYAASMPTEAAARKLILETEESDRESGEYEPDRYSVKERGYCFNDYAAQCGCCTNGICMLEKPDIDCPLVKNRKAADQETADSAAAPALAPGA